MKVNVKANDKQPLYMQLYQEIVTKIMTGEFKAGDKLPSIRSMMIDSNVSKTTVESAYSQLLFEGYIESKEKSGFFVQQVEVSPFEAHDWQIDDISIENERMLSVVDEDTFDFSIWRRIQGYVLKDYANEMLSYGSHQGERLLREEIIRFVREHRGVVASAEQVIVGAGVQHLFGIIVSLLNLENKKIGVEHPGFRKANYVFYDYGYGIENIDVEESGLNIEQLRDTDCQLVYVSPSHQYPTGQVMDVSKRYELLQWAKEREGYIIEDDYDSVLRYNAYPIPALQGLDNDDRVIYLGSFSKLVLPSIRVSYMIIPRCLVKRYETIRSRYTQTSSKFEQLTLALFMKEGFFERYLRKLKKTYSRKHQIIMEYFNEFLPEGISVVGHESGTHILLKVYDSAISETLVDNVSSFRFPLEVVHRNSTTAFVLFTYSGIPLASLNDELEVLLNTIKK